MRDPGIEVVSMRHDVLLLQDYGYFLRTWNSQWILSLHLQCKTDDVYALTAYNISSH